MTEETKGSGGTPDVAGGDEKKKDTVAYDTYRKVLSEKKREQERAREMEEELQQFRKQKADADEADQIKRGEYEKVIAGLKQDKESLQGKLADRDKFIIDGAKEAAFESRLPGRLAQPEFRKFIPKDDILIDPTTGQIDETSLDNSVTSFMDKYSRLLDLPNNDKRLPNDRGDLNQGAKDYATALKECTTQAQLDEVRKKYGRAN